MLVCDQCLNNGAAIISGNIYFFGRSGSFAKLLFYQKICFFVGVSFSFTELLFTGNMCCCGKSDSFTELLFTGNMF
jgi:hypothetical protein